MQVTVASRGAPVRSDSISEETLAITGALWDMQLELVIVKGVGD